MIDVRHFFVRDKAEIREVALYLARLDVGEDRVAEIVVRPARKEKSGAQRGYWHALLGEFGRALGHTPREIKEIVKQEYYGTDVVALPSGRKYEVLPSSEDEDREGYGRLIDFTLQLAAEQGVHLRDPRQTNQPTRNQP